MVNGEDFLLKWNDHHSLFFAGAEELCESEEYTDVTLAAGHKFFAAHKLVLSICSPFFRALFKRLGAHKSVIVLKDVEPKHLELLLQYMYKGEIKVQESELVNVLNAAQSLEIKGLTDSSQKNDSHSSAKPESSKPAAGKRPSPAPGHSESPAPRKRVKPAEPAPAVVPATPPAPAPPVVNVKEEQEVIPVTADNEWTDPGSGGTISGYNEQDQGEYANTVATGYEEMGYDGEEYYEEGMMNMGEGDDRVLIGGLHRGPKNNICSYCLKDCKTPSLLERHITVHTKEKKYVCVCGRGYTRPDRFRKHLESCRVANRESVEDLEPVTQCLTIDDAVFVSQSS